MRAFSSAIVLILGLGQAHANDFYDHNGSVMRVEYQGKNISIVYEKPRAGLGANGVRSGQILFNGRLNSENYLEGMSRLFSSHCGEIDYFVYGDFYPGRRFVLTGVSPVRDKATCAIIDNVHDGPNSRLVFTPIKNAAQSRNLQDSKPKPQAVSGQFSCVVRVKPGSALNMRAGPSTTYGIVGTIPFDACDVEIGSSCQKGWCGVRHGGTNGSVGWVNVNYLQNR
ncbi:MAG: SH3 domain-containing protein [Pseudomonadota bacterium]